MKILNYEKTLFPIQQSDNLASFQFIWVKISKNKRVFNFLIYEEIHIPGSNSEESLGPECALGVDPEALALCTSHVDRQLADHRQAVAQLRFARAEFPVDLKSDYFDKKEFILKMISSKFEHFSWKNCTVSEMNTQPQ